MRTVTLFKLLTVLSRWARMVLDLLVVYTCTNVPKRLGDTDEYMILVDKITDDVFAF